MKKLIVLIAFICFSITVKAQDNVDTFKADTEKLVSIVSESAFTPYIDQFSTMVAEENKEVFMSEINKTFPELYKAIATIYMEEFTHDEIKELLAFYETPIGKKLASKTGDLSQKGMVAGQAWGIKIQQLIEQYQ